MNNILIGNQITKLYHQGSEETTVLNQVSVAIEEGEFVAVMGPSGSGKSTLMYALSGMDDIDSGSVSFEDKDLLAYKESELADVRRTKMGFVFQQPTLLSNLNILDNIILPTLRDNKKSKKELIIKARNLMKKLGILELESRNITQVSGGQLQRAGICRALMSNPIIIFGDEPTGALNSKSAVEIMDIFSTINKDGTAVLLVTHDAKVAARTDRVLFMSDGCIVNEIKFSKYDGTNIEERIKIITDTMQENGI